MDYQRSFEDAIARLKAEGRYRTLANLERDARRFPIAQWRPEGEEDRPREGTVWWQAHRCDSSSAAFLSFQPVACAG
jgi:hypothetical protein